MTGYSYIPATNLYGMIGDIGDTLVNGLKDANKQRTLAALGQSISTGDYDTAAQRALQSGDIGIGMSLLNLAKQNKLDAQVASYLSGQQPGTGGVASPATTSADSGQPRGLRNNNPGNIEDGPFARSLPGYSGTDGRFARFDNLDNGVNAQSALLGKYGQQGINTVAGVVGKWAPAAENGAATGNYANFVARKLGVDPNDQINLGDPATRQRLAYAMGEFENGRPIQQASAGGAAAQPVRVAQAGGMDISKIPVGVAAVMAGSSNPGFKAIGEAVIKNATSSDKYQFFPKEDGTIIAVNKTDPSQVQTLQTGAKPKTQAEFDARTQIADQLQLTGAARTSFLANGQLPDSKVLKSGDIQTGPDGSIIARNDGGPNANWDTGRIDYVIDRAAAGDPKAFVGIGRGAQGANILGQINDRARERGIDPSTFAKAAADYFGQTAEARTFGTQNARMATSSVEAQGAITLGRQASAAVPRGNWVPVNKAVNAYLAGTSDPALGKFGAANLAIINTYARAINPNGQPTVADKEHAREVLNTAMGQDQYNAVLDQMQQEIDMAHNSPVIAKRGLENIRKGKPFMDGIDPKEVFGAGHGSAAPAAAGAAKPDPLGIR